MVKLVISDYAENQGSMETVMRSVQKNSGRL